jgi:hypothetical protein
MRGDLTMQNRYTGDLGDYLKLGILRSLSPGHRLGVAWWLYPDESHNKHGRQIDYLSRPQQWRQFDPALFDALGQIVSSGRRDVRALEAAKLLPGAIFASEVFATNGPIALRRQARHEWFEIVQKTLEGTDLVFVDPDNGLEPAGFSHGSTKAGKSITLSELRELTMPGRSLIVYHHHTRRAGGHHAEIEHWAGRLRECGFATVDALRARPFSPRVLFLLDGPADVRQRAQQIALDWNGLVSWHPDHEVGASMATRDSQEGHGLVPGNSGANRASNRTARAGHVDAIASKEIGFGRVVVPPLRSATSIGTGKRSFDPTGKPGTDHGQYAYVRRCRICGHEYGTNGADVWSRRCPAHDRGAPGLAF